jgi:hypothetical protein
MGDLAAMTPEAFCAFLREQGIERFYLVWDEERSRVVA